MASRPGKSYPWRGFLQGPPDVSSSSSPAGRRPATRGQLLTMLTIRCVPRLLFMTTMKPHFGRGKGRETAAPAPRPEQLHVQDGALAAVVRTRLGHHAGT
jgi:hypothetical protein